MLILTYAKGKGYYFSFNILESKVAKLNLNPNDYLLEYIPKQREILVCYECWFERDLQCNFEK